MMPSIHLVRYALLPALSVLHLSTGFLQAQVVPDPPAVIIVIDRSGSMVYCTRDNGNTPCHDALEMAKEEVRGFGTGASFAVWTFNGPFDTPCIKDRTGGFVEATQALAVLDTLAPEDCASATPLADALCEAADELANTFPDLVLGQKFIAFFTDGGENISRAECSGPRSDTSPPTPASPCHTLSEYSWHRNICETFMKTDVVPTVNFFENATCASLLSSASSDSDVAVRIGGNPPSDALFFGQLASVTGGTLEVIEADDPLPDPSFGLLFGVGSNDPGGLSILYEIEAISGQATELGPIGFEDCGGLDFDPAGRLFAVCRGNGGDLLLVRVDPATGAGTEIGPLTVDGGSISDISFRQDGELFAYDDSFNSLWTIDVRSGDSTLVGFANLDVAAGNAMGFNFFDTLFISQTVFDRPLLYTLDQDNGDAQFFALLSMADPQVDFRLDSIDVHPLTGSMIALLDDDPAVGGGSRFLATLDLLTGDVSIVGPTHSGLDALAWSPSRLLTQHVPILSDGFETGDLQNWSPR